jgi:hypothetical protein
VKAIRFPSGARVLPRSWPRDRVRGSEALSEDATKVEHEAKSEPWVGEPKPLKGRLGQNERLRLLERDHVRRSWEAVEEADLAEEVARLEHANVLRPRVGRDQHLERPARDDEEAAVDVALVDGVVAGRVQPCLRVLQDDGKISLVQVGEKSAVRVLAARRDTIGTWLASAMSSNFSPIFASTVGPGLNATETSPA